MKQLSQDFWNMRGDFKIAHVINIGTHMSVVRRPGGKFVLLDSYEPAKQDLDALMTLTEGGSMIEAVLNVHPFHTIHCGFAEKLAPNCSISRSPRVSTSFPMTRPSTSARSCFAIAPVASSMPTIH